MKNYFALLALALCAASAAISQEGAAKVPTQDQVDAVCDDYSRKGLDNSIFRAIAQGDTPAAIAAAPTWKQPRVYGPSPGPIYWAAQFGDVETVKALVTHGVPADETYDPRRSMEPGSVPVVYLALESDRVEIARFLVQNGDDAEVGYLLRYAVTHGDTALFYFSMPKVRDVDIVPLRTYNTTALLDAAAAGRMDFVATLVSRGADVNAAAVRPYDWQMSDDRPDDVWENDPLTAALRENHLDVARFLLSKKAVPTVYALEEALGGGLADLAADFLSRGAPSRPASLVAACRGGLRQFVAKFLAEGFSPYSEDFEGASAVDVAYESGNRDILKMLTDRGAKPATIFYKIGGPNDDRINVRDAPDVKRGTVLRQISRGDEVRILRRTVQEETINGRTGPWYRVEILSPPDNPLDDFQRPVKLEGWVFGAYLDVR